MLLPFLFGGNPGRLSRGALIVLPLLALLLASCSTVAAAVRGMPPPTPTAILAGRSGSEIVAHHDLPPDDERSVELSGLTWDEASHTLYAVSDNRPWIVPLRLSPDFTQLTFGDPISVTVPHEWDGEGIALVSGRAAEGFFLSNEVGPHVYRLSRSGQSQAEIPLPSHFTRARRNLSLESLTVSPDGRYLFTANEQAIDGELPGGGVGTLVRILRHDLATNEQIEVAYRVDATLITGRAAVADLAALSPTDLLVLERSYFPVTGNGIHIYRADLSQAANVITESTLSDDTPAVPKRPILDLSSLPDGDFPPPLQPQLNRILDNFEGMALGPRLADGRRVLFLVSDNNKSEQQVARLLVLAIADLG
jgi:hypothetical protein